MLGRDDRRTPFATFDTRVKERGVPGSAARGAARRLRRLGLSEATRPESFWVTDTRGPLVAGETDRAHAWAETVATRATRTGRRDPDLISEGLHGKQLQKSLIKEDTGRTTVGEGSLVERQGEAEKESRAPCVY